MSEYLSGPFAIGVFLGFSIGMTVMFLIVLAAGRGPGLRDD